MLSLRNVVAAGVFAACSLSPYGAGAQNYYNQSVAPPPGFRSAIVTDAPVPPDLGRAYPYTSPYATSTQPGVVYLPDESQARPRYRKPKQAVVPAKQARQAELIEELKKRPRIKKVTIDTTAAIAPPVEAAAPPRRKGASAGVGLGEGGERVIRAEAEVRILGNDQMSIRLFRRGTAPRVNAD
jgi:hypothetical protein